MPHDKKVRPDALRTLVERMGTSSAVAQYMGCTPSTISQALRNNECALNWENFAKTALAHSQALEALSDLKQERAQAAPRHYLVQMTQDKADTFEKLCALADVTATLIPVGE